MLLTHTRLNLYGAGQKIEQASYHNELESVSERQRDESFFFSLLVTFTDSMSHIPNTKTLQQSLGSGMLVLLFCFVFCNHIQPVPYHQCQALAFEMGSPGILALGACCRDGYG